MKKKMMATMVLMNQSLNDKEGYRLMTINKDLIDESIAKGGTECFIELLRERIDDLFNNDIESFFDDVTQGDVEFCIKQLAIGNASNIKGEQFWWDEQECVVSLVDPEPKKVWVVTQESNVNGEILFNTLVCDSVKAALAEMQREIEWIKNESFHFRNFDERGDDFEVEQSEHRFFINDDTDDYYEEIMVKETEIITL